ARGYKDLPTALREAHFPTSMPAGDKGSAYAPAASDLAFDELFLLETAMLIKRVAMKKKTGLRSYSKDRDETGLGASLRKMLPFSLTKAQERAIREIKVDMAGDSPMNRLLEGDVGSGKTIVCLIASLLAVDSGLQAAIMAPTSLLAEQHYKTISAYAYKLGLRTTLLLGGMPVKERESRLREIKEGSANLVIGTHALIQKDVEFKALGLVIVDEQHRFGVLQRAELTRKGALTAGGSGTASPDVLIMTATPIPRTLSMTVFANLEVSILDELPPGRRPVKTRLLDEKGRERAYELIRREVAAGAQAYIVYPLVEESEELDLKDATKEKDRLDREVFPGLKVGLIHGRMSPGDKEDVMRGFKDGEIHILVSTTVIEVGLDVPRATVMLIEHAERFGLAQLHQLRGRVGRGKRESYCLLMKNNYTGEDSYRRLKVLESSTDGFRIAEEDLKIRGPGDYLGERQSGLADFRFAWALMDFALVKAARSDAESFLTGSHGLTTGAGPLVAESLKARWSERLELAGIA
ncbi:MAG: ATP-dependent DNA helicase RecG, partial [Thermodesulfobacteriota bacterium]